MNIALDATYSVGHEPSGISVYSTELIGGLAIAQPRVEFLLSYRPRQYLRALRWQVPPNCRRRPLADTWASGKADLFHGLNQRLPRFRYRHAVCTFHDLFVLTAEYSTEDFRRRFAAQAREAVERSDLIVAVSQFTASQVRDLLGVEGSRIRVVHHGVRPPVAATSRSRAKLILHVGAIQRRKNIVRLVEAFERCDPEWRLVLAGSAGYGAAEIRARIDRSPRREQIRVPGYVSRSALEQLYARASVLAFPSLDEGFGLPVLEAMARGTAVLTSNRSALPEVAGDAAVTVDPLEVDSIAAGLRSLVESRELREEYARRGIQRAAQFKWEETVRKTWAVYRELLS